MTHAKSAGHATLDRCGRGSSSTPASDQPRLYDLRRIADGARATDADARALADRLAQRLPTKVRCVNVCVEECAPRSHTGRLVQKKAKAAAAGRRSCSSWRPFSRSTRAF